MNNNLIEIDQAQLVVVDMQQSFLPLIKNHQELTHFTSYFLKLANELNIPIHATEQVPDKLGPTNPEIAKLISNKIIAKETFSSWREAAFQQAITADRQRKTIILCGIETHVCVFQTAMDLLNLNYEVLIIADLVASRREFQHQVALKTLQHRGVRLTSTESLACELIRGANHPHFKTVLNIMKEANASS